MARLTREQSQAITRERILSAAGDVVARDGYDGASVDRIAEAAGYSKGAFYSNFSSKRMCSINCSKATPGGMWWISPNFSPTSDAEEVIDAVGALERFARCRAEVGLASDRVSSPCSP